MSLAHTIMGKWGYTGSACIPMALDDLVALDKLKNGDLIVMCASGGGLNMACSGFLWFFLNQNTIFFQHKFL